MIGRVLAVVFAASLALAAPPAWGDAEKGQGPVETAAEKHIRLVRDAIVDALWVKTDEYGHAGQTLPVINICRMIVQLDPQFTEAYSVAAWLSLQRGKDAQALAFYQQGIERNPECYELLHQLGFAYYILQKHDPEAALPYLKRAAELPSPIPIKRTYAHALARAGKAKEAAEQWRTILKQHPGDPIALKELRKLRAAGKIGKER